MLTAMMQRPEAINPTTLALEHRESAEKSIFVINLTGRCNLKCVHCWNARYIGTELHPDDVRQVIDRIPPKVRIHFLGGEPLLHAHILDLIAYSRRSGHYTSLVTNGLLVGEEVIHKLVQSGLSEIGVSLDGPDEATNDEIRGRGSFHRAWGALLQISSYLVAQGADTKLLLSVTAMQNNALQIPALIERAAQSKLYIDKVVVDPVVLEGRALERPELAVPREMWLDLCERVCSEWRQQRTLQHLTLRVAPFVHRYLTSKYGIFLRDGIIGCPGLESPLGGCLTSDGCIYSCSREFLIRAAQRQGYLPLQGKSVRDILRLTGSLFKLADFNSTLRPFLKPPDGVMCQDCEWKWACRVQCPIRSLLGERYSADLCQEVAKRVKSSCVGEVRPYRECQIGGSLPQLSEYSTFSLRGDVYVKQHPNTGTHYFSVTLDKMVTFPVAIHAEFLFDNVHESQPLSVLRRTYANLYGAPSYYLDLALWKLLTEGLVDVHPANLSK